MFTLDNAIEIYESNAEYERSTGNLLGYIQFKQLSTWLQQLKCYKIEYGEIEIKRTEDN